MSRLRGLRIPLSCLVLAVALLLWSGLCRADQSEDLYQQGLAAYRVRHYADAIQLFQSAYDAKQVPKILLDIGMAHLRLGHAPDAIFFFHSYLREDLRVPPTVRADVELYIQQAQSLMGTTAAPAPAPAPPPPPAKPPAATTVPASVRLPPPDKPIVPQEEDWKAPRSARRPGAAPPLPFGFEQPPPRHAPVAAKDVPDGTTLQVRRYELKRNTNLLTAGISLLSASYAAALISSPILATVAGDPFVYVLVIPVVGPVISGIIEPIINAKNAGLVAAAWSLPWIVIDTGAQIAGLAMISQGAQKRRVPLTTIRILSISPYSVQGGGGLLVLGRF